MTEKRILFLGTPEDKMYLPRLKTLVSGNASIAASCEPVTTLFEVISIAKKRGFDGVATTSLPLLKLLSGYSNSRKQPSIDNYAGSYFEKQGIEFVILNPLQQLITVPYGKFLTQRFLTKLTNPERWMAESSFNWRIASESNHPEVLERLNAAYAIAIDIETAQNPLRITCIGYTAIYLNGSSFSVVLPLTSLYALTQMRIYNDTAAPKIFQNGKYDISYLCMYDAPVRNYLWDTAHLFHSWYSELPKDLGFLQSFAVRRASYWKDLANTGDLHEYYLYNAKDTWATASVFLSLLREMPDWALSNYANEFPLVFPCHLSEMIGVARDLEMLDKAKGQQEQILASESASVNKMLGLQNFNTNSPIQMKQLLAILGCKDLTSTDEKNLTKAASRHPLNNRIISAIIKIRKSRKLISTYLTPGKEYHGYDSHDSRLLPHDCESNCSKRPRILYSLNPHGTDTSRLASKEHHFWTGFNIQNIPRGDSVKQTIIADPGFLFAESDLEQAESRDTAHIAGDESLIKAVSGSRDFHSVNASAFFGVPYDAIYSDSDKKTIDKALRDLAKRVNHGANYNMGPNVLVETMGEENIYRASSLLKLPRHWSAKQIAEHLLYCFHKTYPSIAKIYYTGIIEEVLVSNKLSSKATHSCLYQASDKGLTRYCFSDPSRDKRALNAYVAHPPQSLNAMTLNKAYMKVFYEIALPNPNDFKLCAQIHDSILFQYREGYEHLAHAVKEAMEIPVTVIGYDKKERTFTVPAALKLGGKYWSDL